MRPFVITVTPSAQSATNIAAAQNIVATTPMTLTASPVVLDYARIVGIASTANITSSAFAIVGTNSNGEAQSETIATGPSNSTVVSTKLYKTIISVTPSASVASNVTIGTVNTTLSAESKVYTVESKEGAAATYAVHVTGTVNYTIDEAFNRDFYIKGTSTMQWFPCSSQTSKTSDTVAQGTMHATAIKLVINSYSTGATVNVYVNTGNRL